MSGYFTESGHGLHLVIIGRPNDRRDVIKDTNKTSIICHTTILSRLVLLGQNQNEVYKHLNRNVSIIVPCQNFCQDTSLHYLTMHRLLHKKDMTWKRLQLTSKHLDDP